MTATKSDSDRGKAYVLGHSDGEMERLQSQARLIDPITRRILVEAGIGPGMRVLDVGSGAGDVAFLLAGLVGDAGEVVGIERVHAAVEFATARAAARQSGRVRFLAGEPGDLRADRPFDAVVGRYVLQFQNDPADMLRRLARLTRPGGIVVFHEIDWSGLASFPPASTFDRCCRWGLETLARHGTESRMGSKLYAAYVAAGLSAPSLRSETMIGDGRHNADVLGLMADLTATLLPEMERLGVATAAEVGVDTLLDRLKAEVYGLTGIVMGHLQIGAWTRT